MPVAPPTPKPNPAAAAAVAPNGELAGPTPKGEVAAGAPNGAVAGAPAPKHWKPPAAGAPNAGAGANCGKEQIFQYAHGTVPNHP